MLKSGVRNDIILLTAGEYISLRRSKGGEIIEWSGYKESEAVIVPVSQFDCNPKNLIQILLSRPSLTPAPRSNLVSRRYLSPHKNSALCHKLGINSTLIDKNHCEHEGSLELLFPRFAVFINCQAPAHIQVIVMLQSHCPRSKLSSITQFF